MEEDQELIMLNQNSGSILEEKQTLQKTSAEGCHIKLNKEERPRFYTMQHA